MKKIHILREGVWPASVGPIDIDEKKMEQIADGFSPRLFKPPVIITHSLPFGKNERTLRIASDVPMLSEKVAAVLDPRGLSYGTPINLSMDDSGVWAEFSDDGISNAALTWIKKGNLLSVSPGLYRPTDAGNPTPGRWALRHIALLGDEPPAQKGLYPLSEGLFLSEKDSHVFVVHRGLSLRDRLAIERKRSRRGL